MAEIELNVLVRQYLNHWIAKIEVMRNEVNALESGRNRMNAPVNWQFTTEDPPARRSASETVMLVLWKSRLAVKPNIVKS